MMHVINMCQGCAGRKRLKIVHYSHRAFICHQASSYNDVSHQVWISVLWNIVCDRAQLEIEKKQAVAEKRVTARRLRQFEDDFQQKNGR